MPPEQHPQLACETCSRYSTLAQEGDIILCKQCLDEVAFILSEGYLSTIHLTLTELYEVSVRSEDGEETTIPRFVIHLAAKPPDEVAAHALSEEQVSMAMSYFPENKVRNIAIVSFDESLPLNIWLGLLRPFTARSSAARRALSASLQVRPCAHCSLEFPAHSNSRMMSHEDSGQFYFCSDQCHAEFGSCVVCGRIHRNADFLGHSSDEGGDADTAQNQRRREELPPPRPVGRPQQNRHRAPSLPAPGLCPRCYVESIQPCFQCSGERSRYLMHQTHSPEDHRQHIFLCHTCYTQLLQECNHCEGLFLPWQLRNTNDALDEDDFRLCGSCLDRWMSRIRRHDWRPRRFHHYGEPPLYGIEIETDGYPESAGLFSRRLHTLSEGERFFYIKRDGTLANGFELVFHPRSMDSWDQAWPAVNEILHRVKEYGGKAFRPGTCGFHVHRSKWDLTDASYIKMCLLLKRWQQKLIKVAQRSSNRFAGWDIFDEYIPPTALTHKMAMKKSTYTLVKNGIHNNHRYQCVNFGSNSDSIEFRIYKGSVFSPTLRAYIAFTHFFVEFAHSKLINELSMSATERQLKLGNMSLWDEFCEFLFKAQKSHPFVTDCLDLLHKQRVGHPDWHPITKHWEEV